MLSSIGIGTYLGEADDATDGAYTDAIVSAVENGCNVIDSAINYRFQRSERAVGAAMKELFSKGFSRDEIVLCTKAGFLTPDGAMPADPNEYFAHEFLERGIFRVDEIAAGCHCMAPAYLADQLERSRRNLGVETIDVFYLHNPETQLSEVTLDEFRQRIRAAFTFLETAVAEKKIRAYGMATWNSFREDPKAAGYLSLEEMAGIAGGNRRARASLSICAVAVQSGYAGSAHSAEPNDRWQARSDGSGGAQAGNLADYECGSPARTASEKSASVCRHRARVKGKFHPRSAIRAFRSGVDHRAGRNEPSRSRE